MSASGRNETVYVILPVVGKPYIAKDMKLNKTNDDKCLRTEQKIVGGLVAWVDKKKVKDSKTTIHRMFQDEDPRWAMANKIIHGNKAYKFIVNEDGIHKCCANMAVLKMDYTWIKDEENGGYKCVPDGIVPWFGIIGIRIKEDHLKMLDTEGVLPYKNFMEEEEDEEEDEDRLVVLVAED